MIYTIIIMITLRIADVITRNVIVVFIVTAVVTIFVFANVYS